MVEKSVPTGRKRAQAITELALVFPIFMVILLGVVDLGRAFYQAMALHEAAQAGALVALDWQKVTDLCPIPCATIETLTAVEEAPSGIVIADSDIMLGPNGSYGSPGPAWVGSGAWQPGQTFTITVKHAFTFVSPYLNIGTNRTLTLTSNVNATRNP